MTQPPMNQPPMIQPPGYGRPARRRSPAAIVLLALTGLVVILVGVIVIVHFATGPDASGLRPAIDAAPLPAGTEQVGETVSDGHGDTTPQIERRYRLPSAATSTEDIEQVLVAAHYRVLNQQTGTLADIPGGAWGASSGPGSGDVFVLPAGDTRGGISYLWEGDRLWLTVQDGPVGG